MGRIYRDTVVDGKKRNTLFDTGSVISYIVAEAVPDNCKCEKLPATLDANLARKRHKLKTRCFVPMSIDGAKILLDAFIADGDIGPLFENKRDIEVLVGATGMETWGIRLNPEKQELDLTETKKREFLCY